MTDSENNIEKKINTIWHVSLGISFFSLMIYVIDIFIDIGLKGLFGGIIFPLSSIFGTAILLQSKNNVWIKLIAVILAIICNFFMPLWVATETYFYDIFINRDCESPGYYTLDRFAVQEYNAEFVAFDVESNVRGTNIKRLINAVLTHNRASRKDQTLWIQVRLSGPSASPLEEAKSMVTNTNEAENLIEEDLKEYNLNINNELKKIASSRVYAVACGYDTATGYVTDINIVEVEESNSTNTINKK